MDDGFIPDDPDEVILFSIDGKNMLDPSEVQAAPKGQELLYACPVLGRVAITDKTLQRKVVTAVKRDIGGAIGHQASCFWPRHVLRVVKGGRTVDVVICFECHNYRLDLNGHRPAEATPSIGNRSNPLLNRILADADVPIAP